MNHIQIKRGLKSNLPKLSSGEPAFTTDTKEFFIGSNEGTNILISRSNANLIVNGNFLRAMNNTDNGSLTLVPNTSSYGFGNFLFTNQANSLGDIGINRDLDNSGKINITTVNASPLIEYREKYSRVNVAEGNYSYKASYDRQKITLSFDYTNLNSSPISFQCGCLSNLISASLAANSSGRFSTTFVYTSPYNPTPTFPVFNLIIFKSLTLFSNMISIGNIKAELGEFETSFIDPPLSLTSALLERQFYEKVFSSRISYLTINTLQLTLGDITNSTVYLPKITMPYYKVYSLAGVLQTGFTPSISLNASSGLAEIVFTKLAHGLLDGYVIGTLFIDNRPYGALNK